MIDTGKLIPQRKEGARLSKGTITTIGLVKKDVVKIDSLLKEKLVLSKVRYGILRRQAETEKRFDREKNLENKKSRPQDFGFNIRSNKKGKGFGGFLGGMLKTILGLLGFSIFKSLPGLIRVGKMIKVIAVPFTALVGVAFLTLRTIVNVGRKISGETRGLDPNKINKDAVNKGINNFSTELVRAAQVFAGGVAAGIITQRVVRGRVVGIKEARDIGLESLIDRRKRGINKRATSGQLRVRPRSQTDILNDIIKDEINIRPRNTGAPRSDLKTGSMIGDYEYDSRFSADENIDRLIEFEKQKELRELRGKRGRPSKRIKQLEAGQMTLGMAEGVEKIGSSTKAGKINETILAQKQLSQNIKVRVDKTFGRKKGVAIDFTNVPDVEEIVDMEELGRLEAELRGKKPPKSLSERMSAAYNRRKFPRKMNEAELAKRKAAKLARVAAKEAKERAAKLATKKGLSRLLFKFGGEALEQSVKQVVKQSVSTIPLIGDLIGFLLDVFLFKQPVGRAAFMASGSILGGIIGGVLGLIGGPPGVLVGSIIGGIGGDLLGGAFYDLIVGRKSTGVVQQVGESSVKKAIKGAGLPGFLLGGFTGVTGGYVHPLEFVIDRDSTLALEKNAPGFLMALNKASGSGAIDVLRSYASYEGIEGTETLIPLPFEKVVTRTVAVGGESRDDGDFVSPFMDLYRRG